MYYIYIYRHLVLLLGLGMGGVPLERPLDGLRNRRWGRQVCALGLETVLVGDVGESNVDAVVALVAVRALRLHRLVLAAGVLYLAFLVGFDAVARLVRPLVRAVRVRALLRLADDRDYLGVGWRGACARREQDQGYLWTDMVRGLVR